MTTVQVRDSCNSLYGLYDWPIMHCEMKLLIILIAFIVLIYLKIVHISNYSH